VFHVGIEPSTASVGHPADEGKLSAEKPWGAVLGRSPAVSLSIPTSIQWKIGESCDRDQ